ncbi:MAG TPA: rhodanese-like domain-containing protein [Actinobacteria bacterium]|nr:putative adenylyltransferase/sulfurtransferase MoeZ [bacterium BMS3Bbin02]HDL41632.1 rhodanese-like domain-containing protein [Actinomycetota bacterium]
MKKTKTVTPAQANTLITDSGALLIDVREQDEWNKVRIPGAVHKPMSRFADWHDSLPRDRTVVVHCQSGARSAKVVKALRKHSKHPDVTNLSGGIIDWAQDNYPIDAGPAR